MSFLGKFFGSIGKFFGGIFKSGFKEWFEENQEIVVDAVLHIDNEPVSGAEKSILARSLIRTLILQAGRKVTKNHWLGLAIELGS